MDDNTKNYEELNVNDNLNDFEDTKKVEDLKELNNELINEEKVTVTEQIKEIKKEELDNKIEEIKKENNNNKKINKILVVLLIILALLIIIFLCYLLFIKKDSPITLPNDPVVEEPKIIRPDDSLNYTILKQNTISIYCNKTKDNKKIENLTKGLIIECDFNIKTEQKITELYFDLDNSTNAKLNNYENNTDSDLINENKTYKLTSKTPFNKSENEIKFYYEITNDIEKTGYVEIKNIVFKDNNNSYYKMINNIVTFPPEYTDKIYLYKEKNKDTDEINYKGSKTQLTDKSNLELVDTFKCELEECEIKNNNKNYFIIYDKELLIYDLLTRTKTELKINEEKFDYKKYEYEVIVGKDNKLLGVLFKKNYKDNTNCKIVKNVCLETSISGYEVSYYSISKNMFTVALDFNFIGANAYKDYDIALMLSKDNKFGIFSYTEDKMILELSKDYKSIEYLADSNLIKLELYDKTNKNNYYTYYNLNNNSFTINTKLDIVKKLGNSNNVYYIESYNRQGNIICTLYNSDGKPFTNLPYILKNNFTYSDDNTVVIKVDDVYDIYDSNGKFIETSDYIQSGLSILGKTDSYLVALTKNNTLEVTNKEGKTIKALLTNYNKDTMKLIKYEENNKQITILITDTNITEENKNAYIFKVNSDGTFTKDYTLYSDETNTENESNNQTN